MLRRTQMAELMEASSSSTWHLGRRCAHSLAASALPGSCTRVTSCLRSAETQRPSGACNTHIRIVQRCPCRSQPAFPVRDVCRT